MSDTASKLDDTQANRSHFRVAIIWASFGPYHLARLRATQERLRPKGIEVTGLQIADNQGDYLFGQSPRDRSIRTIYRNREYNDLGAIAKIAGTLRTLNALKPNLVFICGYSAPENIAALLWSKINGSQAILMFESTKDDKPRHPAIEKTKRLIVQTFDGALVGGSASREYLHELGRPYSQVFTGYNVVDNDHFASGATAARNAVESSAAVLGVPAGGILCVSRFLPRKNVAGLIRMYEAVCAFRSDAPPLIVVGDGTTSERKTIEAEVAKCKAARVLLAGKRSYTEMPILYGISRGLVIPSLAEPWGLVVNEAMAAGLPVAVSAACGCARDLLIDGENGWLFDPKDETAFLNTLNKVVDAATSNHWITMGRSAEKRIGNFGPSAFADSVAAIITNKVAR